MKKYAHLFQYHSVSVLKIWTTAWSFMDNEFSHSQRDESEYFEHDGLHTGFVFCASISMVNPSLAMTHMRNYLWAVGAEFSFSHGLWTHSLNTYSKKHQCIRLIVDDSYIFVEKGAFLMYGQTSLNKMGLANWFFAVWQFGFLNKARYQRH